MCISVPLTVPVPAARTSYAALTHRCPRFVTPVHVYNSGPAIAAAATDGDHGSHPKTVSKAVMAAGLAVLADCACLTRGGSLLTHSLAGSGAKTAHSHPCPCPHRNVFFLLPLQPATQSADPLSGKVAGKSIPAEVAEEPAAKKAKTVSEVS